MTKKADTKANTTKDPVEKKKKVPSYQSIIIESMKANKGIISREALMKATGADERNLSVAVSILKNGKRTKAPLDIRYFRSTKTFYALPMAAKALAAAEKILADSKPKKKVAAKKAK